jgi:predicted metal-dependent hydrolase
MIARMTPNRQLTLLAERDATLDGWRVRPSPRARRLAVRVLPGGLVEIVVPRGTRPRAIEQFVTRNRRWIDGKVALYRPRDATSAGSLPEVIRFAASGREYVVEYLDDGRSAARLETQGSRVVLIGDRGRPAALRHLLQRFTLREAHETLAPWLARLSAESGLGFARLQVRRQRTRWGSCSRSGTISLNACLLFQPQAVVRYLLVHELAHTRHMNHSRRFWRLVERLEPCWRELDHALSGGWRDVPSWALD